MIIFSFSILSSFVYIILIVKYIFQRVFVIINHHLTTLSTPYLFIYPFNYVTHSYTTTCALLNSRPLIIYPVLKQSATLLLFYLLSSSGKLSGTGIFIIPYCVLGSNSSPIGLNSSIPNILNTSCNYFRNFLVYECVYAHISIL